MPDTHLPKKVLHRHVKGIGVVGPPRKTWNDVLLSDIHSLNIRRPYSDAHHAWKAKTVIAHTCSMLESVIIIAIIIIIIIINIVVINIIGEPR